MQRSSSIWVRAYRLLLAAAILVAIFYQLAQLAGSGVSVITYLSFFTVQSNLIAAVVLLWNGIRPARGEPTLARDLVRGAAVLYLAITGVVYALLLSAYNAQVEGALLWINLLHHYIAPLVVFIDWLIDPPGPALTFRRALVWVVYPLLYLAYSLLRGAAIGWYPYPFLDPGAVGGYGGVAVFSAITLLGALLFIGVLVGGGRWVRGLSGRGQDVSISSS
jgi:hypothetical protein